MKKIKIGFIAMRIKNKPIKVDFYEKKTGKCIAFKAIKTYKEMPKSVQIFLRESDWKRLKALKKEIVIR